MQITTGIIRPFAAYYQRNPSWGSLHVVLADRNVEIDSVYDCIRWAEGHRDYEGRELGLILLKMTERQRGILPDKVYAWIESQKEHSPEIPEPTEVKAMDYFDAKGQLKASSKMLRIDLTRLNEILNLALAGLESFPGHEPEIITHIREVRKFINTDNRNDSVYLEVKSS